MKYELLIAILAGLGGMFGWGLADVFVKRVTDKIGDLAPLFWSHFVGIFPLLTLFLFHPSIPHLSNLQWVFLFLLGALDGLSYIPLYIAFRKGLVSLLSPIYATYPVIVAILSALFLGEVIPVGRQVIFLIIFIGILLINGNPLDILLFLTGKRKSVDITIKGLPEIFLAVFLNSLWILGINEVISDTSWIPIILAIRLISTLTLFLYSKITKREVRFHDKGLWKFIFLIGIFDVLAFISVTYGLGASTYISIIAMLSSAFSLPVIVIGHFFLREGVTRIQIVGGLIIIGGIMLLASI